MSTMTKCSSFWLELAWGEALSSTTASWALLLCSGSDICKEVVDGTRLAGLSARGLDALAKYQVSNKQITKAIARAELVAIGSSAVLGLISAWIHDDPRFTFSEKHLRVTEASKMSKPRDPRNSRERPTDSFQEIWTVGPFKSAGSFEPRKSLPLKAT